MKKNLAAILSVVLVLSLLTACGGATPERILKSYSDFPSVGEADNGSGIYLSKITLTGDEYLVEIGFASAIVSQNLDNTSAMAGRLFVVDAQDVSSEVAFTPNILMKTSFNTGGAQSQQFFAGLGIPKEGAPAYVLVRFSGVDASEAAELETPALFFILHLDGNDSASLTKAPLLGDGANAK